MTFKPGDRVKVVRCDSVVGFVHLKVGTVVEIQEIWEGEEYPIELKEFTEHVLESEIELTEEELTENEER